MQTYNNFRAYDYDISDGTVQCAWYDDGLPLTGQRLLRRNHKIPIEAEQNSWTHAQFLAFWILEIEDVADVPQFLQDEANATRLESVDLAAAV